MAYITVQDLRNEGITDPPYNENWCGVRIELAQEIIEELFGCFYEVHPGYVIKLRGLGHDTLWLPVPPVSEDSITSVVVDGEEIDPEYYEVDISFQRNPKLIKLSGTWSKSHRYVITGDFGFVKSDGSTPSVIKDLTKRIVIHNLPPIGNMSQSKERNIIRESLNGYSYELREDMENRQGFFSDPSIDNLIALYKPRVITTV